MAEGSAGRALRDGSQEGEHAVALSIRDALSCPLGAQLFDHFLRSLAANLSAGRSPARGLVLVALDRSPSFYLDLLGGLGSGAPWLRILDCYSDPLGWKARLRSPHCRSGDDNSAEELCASVSDVKDVDKLLALVLDLGRGIVGAGRSRFAVAIDSVSVLLRHAPLASVAGLISNLRSHGQVSSMLWLIRSDLHEPRICAAFDYLSTMVAILEPSVENPAPDSNSELNLLRGRIHLRMKRRNGRVKILTEEFKVGVSGLTFVAPSAGHKTQKQMPLPKLQFNLSLSEKERLDKERVVLPFEHQGTGKPVKIYDGRQQIREPMISQHDEIRKNGAVASGKGEIHYFRDSDDELPDSDEDPDDDLDI
ncbi:elongator complex protein [Wolffia australiana]